MKRKLILSNAALRDLEDVFEYLAEQFADIARAREFVDSLSLKSKKSPPAVDRRPSDATIFCRGCEASLSEAI